MKKNGTLKIKKSNLLMVLLMAAALATPVAVQAAQPEQGIFLDKAPAEWICIQKEESNKWISSKLEQIKGFIQIDGKDYVIWKDDMTIELIECMAFYLQGEEICLKQIGTEKPVSATKVDEVTLDTFATLPGLPEGDYRLMEDMVLFSREEKSHLCHYLDGGKFENLYLDDMKFVQIGETYFIYGVDEDGILSRIEISPDIDTPEVEMVPIRVGLDLPVTSGIKTKADFFALEKLPVGYYEIEDTDVSILVKDYQRKDTGELLTQALILENENEVVESSLYNARLVRDANTLALWGESLHRSLDKVDLLADEISLEEDYIWMDFPSQKEMEICGSWPNCQTEEVTFGECQTDLGWHYGLYTHGEELGEGLDVESRLHFINHPGIAVDEDGKAYMLYFSSRPYTIQLVQVEMPVKVDYINDYWYIGTHLYREDNSYGYAAIVCGDQEYIIKTVEKEALLQNGLDNLKRYQKPLSFEPTYEVVEAIPENFETFVTYYGTDALDFHVDAYFPCEDGDGNYFFKTFHIEEIDNHWLGLVIPDEEFINTRTKVQLVDEFVPEGQNLWLQEEHSSWSEVQAQAEKLADFLDKWEKSHEEEIVNFFMSDCFQWVECEPEAAKKYGIRYDGIHLQVNSNALVTYFESLKKLLLSEGYGEDYAERKLQDAVNRFFVGHPEVFEANRKVAAQYGVKAMDARFWLEYLEEFDIWEKASFFRKNPDVQKIVPIFYKEVMAEYDQLFE